MTGEERENYQRSIKLNKTITHCFLGLRINRHPQPIVLNQTNLTVDFTNNTFKLLKLLPRHNRQIVNNDNIAKSSV